MKLNQDCIRDILLYIEENTPRTLNLIDIPDIYNALIDNYSSDEILYHIKLIDEAGFISNVQYTFDGGCLERLSWNGHQYLISIKDKTIWEKLKDGTVDISCMSLDVLGQIAKELTLSIAKKKLGLE